MIIYGSSGKELAKECLTDKCPNCGSQNAIAIHVFQRYAHVFWIPLFPLNKTGASHCDQCKQVFKPKQMPASLNNAYQGLKSRSKTPIWTFTGVAIIAAIIFASVVNDKRKDIRNAQLILEPTKGDIFEIKTKDNQFTLYKVADVTGNTVLVYAHNYETDRATGITELMVKGDSAYSEEAFSLTKYELKQMLSSGEILDIDRK